MSYVLISLHRESDAASTLAHTLANALQLLMVPQFYWAGEHPDHSEIHDAVCYPIEGRPLAGVIFGHGGHRTNTLRSQQNATPVWATPKQFGEMFTQSRVYVFACETTPDPQKEPREQRYDTFGEGALEAGVSVYVGHYQSIQPPESPSHWTQQQQDLLRCTTTAAIRQFLNGEECGNALRKAIYDAIDQMENMLQPFTVSDELLPNQLDGAIDWGWQILCRNIAKSLRVGRCTRNGDIQWS
jgi:hypothetical protein